MHIYNDAKIRALICCVCARIQVDTGLKRSRIDFRSGNWFSELPTGSLKKNFSMGVFKERYCQFGSPLSPMGYGHRNPD